MVLVITAGAAGAGAGAAGAGAAGAAALLIAGVHMAELIRGRGRTDQGRADHDTHGRRRASGYAGVAELAATGEQHRIWLPYPPAPPI